MTALALRDRKHKQSADMDTYTQQNENKIPAANSLIELFLLISYSALHS